MEDALELMVEPASRQPTAMCMEVEAKVELERALVRPNTPRLCAMRCSHVRARAGRYLQFASSCALPHWCGCGEAWRCAALVWVR